MKKAWGDLKSFITVSMIVLLFVIVIANIFGKNIGDNLLILVTNLITAVFTYYFTRKKEIQENEGFEDYEEDIDESEEEDYE